MKRVVITMVFSVFTWVAFAQQPSRFEDKDSTKTKVKENEEETQIIGEEETAFSKQTARKSQSNFMERARFGGNIGFSFGSYTYIELSPRMFYLLKDNLGLGLGLSYYYWKDNRDYPPGFQYKTSGSTYGVNLSAWYNPFGPIVLQAEYEPLNFDIAQGVDQNNRVIYEREWVQGLLLGGGIRQQTGRVNIFILVLYNVLYDPNRSFYSSPWVFRMGAGF